jgi:hypothetical protein
MTHYDKLIDSIVEEMYYLWSENTTDWNESEAKTRAHNILTMVEEFQATRTKINQWRASD